MHRWVPHLAAVLLLCQCATKHQPIEFAPYFWEQPEELFSDKEISEMRVLENRSELSLLEKRRLFTLYQIELRGLRAGTPRHTEISSRSEALGKDLEPFFEKINEATKVSDESPLSKPVKLGFANPRLKKEFSQAAQDWNKDRNDVALQRIDKIIADSELKAAASEEEWLRVLNLRFRISFDVGDREKSRASYQALKESSSCSAQTAQAGFLLALILFTDGALDEARKMLSENCDPDASISARIRRAYWSFRLYEGVPEKQNAFYHELMTLPVPGYYAYLAQSRLGQPYRIPVGTNYSWSAFSVSSSADKAFNTAENALQNGLRKDAVKFLNQATTGLKSDPKDNLDALLYASRLYQASGNHLEAMKILSSLMESYDPAPLPSVVVGEFVSLFHRPFESDVTWLSRTWGVDPLFAYSIMRQESAFNPGAVSSADARGLMQLMPSLARFLGDQWNVPKPSSTGFLFRGKENLRLAIFHLHQLQSVAPHPALMAASYNAGINRVSGWWRRNGKFPLDVFVELVPVNETRNYIKLVLRNYLIYQGLQNGGTVEPGKIPLTLPPYGLGVPSSASSSSS